MNYFPCAMTNYLIKTTSGKVVGSFILIVRSEDAVHHGREGSWQEHAQLWQRELTPCKSGNREEKFWSSVALPFPFYLLQDSNHGMGPLTLRVCLTPLNWSSLEMPTEGFTEVCLQHALIRSVWNLTSHSTTRASVPWRQDACSVHPYGYSMYSM